MEKWMNKKKTTTEDQYVVWTGNNKSVSPEQDRRDVVRRSWNF